MSDAWSGIYMKINERTALINFWSFGLVKWKSILKELAKKRSQKKKSHNNDVGNIENRTAEHHFVCKMLLSSILFKPIFKLPAKLLWSQKRIENALLVSRRLSFDARVGKK